MAREKHNPDFAATVEAFNRLHSRHIAWMANVIVDHARETIAKNEDAIMRHERFGRPEHVARFLERIEEYKAIEAFALAARNLPILAEYAVPGTPLSAAIRSA